MKLKKLLSLVMAMAMVLALSVPAFASATKVYEPGDDSDQYAQSIPITTKMFIPTIVLKVPTIGDNPVVLNPYRIDFTGTDNLLNGTVQANAADMARQVISPVYAIYNQSNVKLDFEVTATTTVAGNLTLASSAPGDTDKNNKAQISVIVVPDDNTALALSTNTSSSGAAVAQTQLDSANGKEIKLDSTKTVTVKDMSIAAVSATDKAASKYNFIQFQFQGSLSGQPTTPWAETDTLTTTLAFTFTPHTAAATTT